MPLSVIKEALKKIREIDIDKLESERDELQKRVQNLEDQEEKARKKAEADLAKIKRDLEDQINGLKSQIDDLGKRRSDAIREKDDEEKARKKAEADLAEFTTKYDLLKEGNEKLQKENDKLKIEQSSNKSDTAYAIILFIAVFLVFLPLNLLLKGSLYGFLNIDNDLFLRFLDLCIAATLGLIMISIYSKRKKQRIKSR
jgi:Flp pilus assembly protein TadB